MKLYKLKNHDTGETYRIRAKSFGDAKEIYNEYIYDRSNDVAREVNRELNEIYDKYYPDTEKIKKEMSKVYASLSSRKGWNARAKAKLKALITGGLRDILTEDEWVRKMIKDGWSSYTFKTGLRSDAFKQYLRDRGIYFEASQDGEYTHFKVKNANEAVDRRANEIVRQLKDSFIEDNSFDGLFQLAKELKEISFKSDEQAIRSVFLKAGTVTKQVERSIAGLSKQYKTKLDNLKKDPHNKTVEKEFYKVANTATFIKNALINCAQFFKTPGVGITRALSIWNNGRIVGERFEGKTDKYLSMAEKYHDRFIRLYQQLNTILKDSLTEDTVIYGEWEGSNKDGLWYVNTNDLQKTKRELKSAGYKFKAHYINPFSSTYKYIVEYTKDSLTEDVAVNYIEKYKDVKIYQREDNMKYTATVYGNSFEEKDLKNLKTKIDETKNEHIKKYRNLDSLTEDANLAQLEIQSMFNEELDDADEIKYIGFNDKRKISFYEYNDEYYAYFDLEGRAEKIDKKTVQNILKKNIIKPTNSQEEGLFKPGNPEIAATSRDAIILDVFDEYIDDER